MKLYPMYLYETRMSVVSVIFKVSSDTVYVSFDIQHQIRVKQINEFITSGYNQEIDEYMKTQCFQNIYYSKCMKKKREYIEELMSKHSIENMDFIEELLMHSIPASLKANLIGNMFNEIVFHTIEDCIKEFSPRFVCKREVSIPQLPEKLDFVLYDTKTNRKLIGYNQLDFWGGGHQLNRGDKYIISNTLYNSLPNNIKLICVIHNFTKIKKMGSKKSKVFDYGIQYGRIAYINHLSSIIKDYFFR